MYLQNVAILTRAQFVISVYVCDLRGIARVIVTSSRISNMV